MESKQKYLSIGLQLFIQVGIVFICYIKLLEGSY